MLVTCCGNWALRSCLWATELVQLPETSRSFLSLKTLLGVVLALFFVLATSLRDTSGGRVDVNPVRLAWGILQHPWVIELALRLRRWRCEACLQQIPGLRYRLRRKPRSEPFCAFYEHRLRLVHPNGLPPCLLCRREAKHFYRQCLSTIELVCVSCYSGAKLVGDSRKSICDK